jgi:predicted nucleic acid-binding protein
VRIAYVDTSCLVAVAFGEPGGRRMASTLEGFDRLVSSDLLEAEFRSALTREGVEGGETLLSWLAWYLPDRPLSEEFRRILDLGYLRGADLFHLGAALRLKAELPDLVFLSLDDRQSELARSLGFPGPDKV